MKTKKIVIAFSLVFIILIVGGAILGAWLAIKDYQTNEPYLQQLSSQNNS